MPAETTIRYDLANSEAQPGTAVYCPVIITVAAGPATYAVRFRATASLVFSSAAGIDGTGAPNRPYGIEIRGDPNAPTALSLEADGTGARMDALIKGVLVTGSRDFTFHAHAINGAQARFRVEDSWLTADTDGTMFGGVVRLLAGRLTAGTTCAGAAATMQPTFSDAKVTVDQVPAAGRFAARYYGVYMEACSGGTCAPLLTMLEVDGHGSSLPQEGIDQGIYLAASQTAIGRLRLESGGIKNCRTYGAQVAAAVGQGVPTPGTIDLAVVGSSFEGNGLNPDLTLVNNLPGCGLLIGSNPLGILTGKVVGNLFAGNLIGVGLYGRSATSPELSITSNTASSQIFNGTLGATPTGVGMVVTADGAGTVGTACRSDSNRFTGNAREAVLIEPGLYFAAAGAVTPLFVNDRMYANGEPPPSPASDAVRIVNGPAGNSGLLGQFCRVNGGGDPGGVIAKHESTG